MFKLRDQHLEAFKAAHEQQLVRQISDEVRGRFPETAGKLPEQELGRRVYSGIIRARGYGLRKAATLGLFVQIQFEIAPNFDEHPRIKAYLQTEVIAPESRLDYALTSASTNDWDEAKKMPDPRDWG